MVPYKIIHKRLSHVSEEWTHDTLNFLELFLWDHPQ